ncbi:MAG: UDP-N-acetylmuramoyl-tripeptide--D-alanyl-D-alanine ligase [Neomegalonema sp.]|nr:UDP-N-acetylmuramoyl-tripeptide--D-alanyl-D-alanine ligase [Neomegalonema sp.]
MARSEGALWTGAAVAAATGSNPDLADWQACGVTADSREIEGGELFIALQGARDGHDFVAQALGQGAAAALVSRRPEGVAADAPLVMVPDTMAALEDLGRAARARASFENGAAIAVTGSVGKTSTKDMLAHMLGPQGPTHAAVKSFNNHLGVPLTLARTPADTRFGVYEIGMNHPGEITPLSRMVRPHVALITTVEPVHLEAFDSVEEIADAKAEIFDGLEPGGAAVLNADNPHFERLKRAAEARGARIVSFGEKGAQMRLLRVIPTLEGSTIEAEAFGAPLLFKLAQPGAHFAMNALGALAAVVLAGADLSKAAMMLGSWHAVSGRGDLSRIDLGADGAFTLVDESYNANPASMAAAITAFAARPRALRPNGDEGRRLLFLTDMLELGPDAPELHAGLACQIDAERIDMVHCAGPMMSALHEALPQALRGAHCADAQALADLAVTMVLPGDAVMVKGSNGSKAGLIARRLREMAVPAEEG